MGNDWIDFFSHGNAFLFSFFINILYSPNSKTLAFSFPLLPSSSLLPLERTLIDLLPH